jgi:hypothetical protein
MPKQGKNGDPKLRSKCGGLDHVHAAREGSDWLTALLGALGFGLESRRISVRIITYIENHYETAGLIHMEDRSSLTGEAHLTSI